MTTKEKEDLIAIQGTSGWHVIKRLVEQKIKAVESVRNIDQSGLIAEQALARKLTVQVLDEFFYDLSILEKPIKDSNTYE